MPAPLPRRTPFFPPEPPRRRFNRLAIWLAFGVTALFIPLTYQYQNQRTRQFHARPTPTPVPTPPRTIEETGDPNVPAEIRQWHMDGIDGLTEAQVRTRFGKPVFSRDYNTTYGAFLGPEFGLKHYYLNDSPGFDERAKASKVVWTYPQYSNIRELIFKLRESYMTVWLSEPRVEVSLKEGTADAVYPRTGPSEWVVIDNYRVGQDLVKNPPTSNGEPTPAQ